MMKAAALAVLMATAAILPAQAGDMDIDHEIKCGSCAAWNQPQAPFKLHGNAWYVGTKELSSVLISGPKGHILIDGALPQSAPLIEANIKKLGFKIRDVKYILNSHEHFDHAGGIAALQRASGAQVLASARGAQVLMDGVIASDDPQFDPQDPQRAPKVPKVRAVADGEVLTLGPLRVTAHATPAHSPGGTTWTWQSCENRQCLDLVYADSLTAVSVDGFRVAPRAPIFAAVFDKVAALKCDIVVAAHPVATGTLEALAARKPGVNPFVNPKGCRELVEGARKRFDERLSKEKAS